MSTVVVVTGGRDYREREDVWVALAGLDPEIVVHGDCGHGADSYAASWCGQHEVVQIRFPARWNREGKAAGPIRNDRMLAFVESALDAYEVAVVFFPGNKGTADCVAKAKRLGLKRLDGEALARSYRDNEFDEEWD